MKNTMNIKLTLNIGISLGFLGYFLFIPLLVFNNSEALDYVFISVSTTLLILVNLKRKIIRFRIVQKNYKLFSTLLVDSFLIMFTAGYLLFTNLVKLYGRSGYYSTVFGFVDLPRLALIIIGFVGLIGYKTKYDADNIFKRRSINSYVLDVVTWLYYLSLVM